MNRQVVAYFRVSTDRQGASGLGLEAQERAVSDLCKQRGFTIAKAFTEVESGGNLKRPLFAEARALCRKNKFLLVIAKIDRLSRDLGFICALRDSGIEFMAADMPDANRLTVNLMAIIAEHEREMISKRTKEALASKKARGDILGSPHPERGAAAGRAAVAERVQAHYARVMPIICEIRRLGITTQSGIAQALNDRGVPTSRGGENRWHQNSVRYLLERADGVYEPVTVSPPPPPVTTKPAEVKIPFRSKPPKWVGVR